MWLLLIPLGVGLVYWGCTTKSVSRTNANPPPTLIEMTEDEFTADQAKGNAGPLHGATQADQDVIDAMKPPVPPIMFTNG